MANPRRYLLKRGRAVTSRGKARKTGASFDVTWEETADVPMPELDAQGLAYVVRDAMLQALRQAVLAGVKPDTGTRHLPLRQDGHQGRRARRGKRPNVRGNTGAGDNKFYDLILGTAIVGNDKKATFQVVPDDMHAGYVAREMNNGVEFFTAPQQAIDEAVEFWAGVAIAGQLPGGISLGPKRAKDVK